MGFFLPFIRFIVTRRGTGGSPRSTGGSPRSARDDHMGVEASVSWASAASSTADDDEEVAAHAVQMVVNFASYVESAEGRGILAKALDVSVMQSIFAMNFMWMLPRSDATGPILFTRVQNMRSLDEEALERTICWFFLHCSLDMSCVTTGLSVVFDLDGVGFSDAYRFLKMDTARLAPTGCFPIRLKQIFILNQPWWMSAFWNVASRLLDPKVRSRVTFSGSDLMTLRILLGQEVPLTPDAVRVKAWMAECLKRGTLLERLEVKAPRPNDDDFPTIEVNV